MPLSIRRATAIAASTSRAEHRGREAVLRVVGDADRLVGAVDARRSRRPGRRTPRRRCRISGVTPASTVGVTRLPSASPPESTSAPLARASSISSTIALARAVVDHRADHRALVARVAGRRACPRARPASRPARPATERSATMRSVDMQIWPEFMNAPKLAASAAASRSASASTTCGALPPSSSRQRLRCSAHFIAMICPTFEEPVKFTRRTAGWAISSSTTSGASPGAWMIRLIAPAGRPASASARDDRGVRARALLGRLEHDGVAVGQRRRDRARGEDHRRVPRRHADHDAGGLADAHGERAGHVGGDDLADHRVGLRRRLAQHPRREVAVEHPPAERRRRPPRSSTPAIVGRALHQQVRRRG